MLTENAASPLRCTARLEVSAAPIVQFLPHECSGLVREYTGPGEINGGNNQLPAVRQVSTQVPKSVRLVCRFTVSSGGVGRIGKPILSSAHASIPIILAHLRRDRHLGGERLHRVDALGCDARLGPHGEPDRSPDAAEFAEPVVTDVGRSDP